MFGRINQLSCGLRSGEAKKFPLKLSLEGGKHKRLLFSCITELNFYIKGFSLFNDISYIFNWVKSVYRIKAFINAWAMLVYLNENVQNSSGIPVATINSIRSSLALRSFQWKAAMMISQLQLWFKLNFVSVTLKILRKICGGDHRDSALFSQCFWLSAKHLFTDDFTLCAFAMIEFEFSHVGENFITK